MIEIIFYSILKLQFQIESFKLFVLKPLSGFVNGKKFTSYKHDKIKNNTLKIASCKPQVVNQFQWVPKPLSPVTFV